MLGILIAAAAIGTPAAVALSSVRAAPALAGGPTISGTGSSYAAVAINQWVAEVAVTNGDNINYQTSSSVIGLNDFAQKQVDFGASEIGYSTGQAQYTPSAGTAYQYLPDVAGATCIMYNLSGSSGQIKTLRLNSSVMLDIFTGLVKTWNDPQIQALNPGSLLPSQPITVVYRTDPSGDNYLFSNYLYVLHSQAWNTFAHQLGFQNGPNAIWPFPQGGSQGKYNFNGWIGQSGSDNASNYVASSNGTVTYVETAYAILHHMPCASVQNASGNWIQPSEFNDAVALESDALQPDLEQKLDGVYTSPQPSAYPISAYSYLITTEGQTNPQKGAVEGRFIMFLACKGQQSAGALGYSPLPPNLVADDFKAVSRITGAAPPPSSPTAANCPNPYVDGTTPLPGQQQNPGGGTTTTTTTPPGGGTTTTTTTPSSTTGPTGTKGHGKTGTPGNKPPPKLPPDVSYVAPTTTLPFGEALLGAVNGLDKSSSGTSSMLAWTFGVLLLAAVPPMVLAVRRRRARAALEKAS